MALIVSARDFSCTGPALILGATWWFGLGYV